VTVAFLFPGQGSQQVGMGAALIEESVAARAVFDVASEAAGLDLARLCADGPIERLTATELAQPAIVATSLAALAVVRERTDLEPDWVIGHSVGEYAALTAAGALTEGAALGLVRARGLAMAEADDGAMAAVIGLDDAVVEALCAGIEGVWPANYNSPGQLVVSGTPDGVEALCVAARDAGARRALPLNVSGAFHSPLMAPAAERLRPALEAVSVDTPGVGFLSTTTGAPARDPAEIRELLVRQLTAPVRFTQGARALADLGVDLWVELGAGGVLCGLLRRIDRSARCLVVAAPADVAPLQEAVHG
jgi:[acyl-carrier-protein] S-malonyltransferase